jgi:hypothetical protein
VWVEGQQGTAKGLLEGHAVQQQDEQRCQLLRPICGWKGWKAGKGVGWGRARARATFGPPGINAALSA